MEFTKELGIQENDSLTINNEKGSVKKILNSCIWIENQSTDVKNLREYCISSIGQLLMVNPVFEKQEIQEKIEAIKAKDEEIIKKRKTLSGVLGSELIGEGKPYLLQDGGIWYSFGKIKSNDGMSIRPSATPITKDVLEFEPINETFSKDSKNAYYQYYKIGGNESNVRPDIKSLEPLADSKYSSDGDNVFHKFNRIPGAHIEDGKYEVISNDNMELLHDSENNWFAGHQKAEIKNPEQCEHIVDSFLFDGENIYMVSGLSVHNFTEVYGLNPGSKLSKVGENTYKVGEKSFTYDGIMKIKWL